MKWDVVRTMAEAALGRARSAYPRTAKERYERSVADATDSTVFAVALLQLLDGETKLPARKPRKAARRG